MIESLAVCKNFLAPADDAFKLRKVANQRERLIQA